MLLFLLVSILLGGVIVGFTIKQWVYDPNVKKNLTSYELFIPTGSDYLGVKKILEEKGFLDNMSSFDFVAGVMKFKKSKIKPGKYSLNSKMSNRSLISLLRSGKQTPVKIIFNNVRTVDELMGKIAPDIEADSSSLVAVVHDSTIISKWGYNDRNILSMFIPNTYEFFWNTNANSFVERMKVEHDKFWKKKDRIVKATALGLEEKEVYILASIVQKETLANDEKPRVASVYLNRLKRGILLQADPTVVFATGQFGLKRVLNKHLKVDSPYNTYMYEGLPPGPICMPDVSSIDAVLNPEDTNYLYFCARPDGSGHHAFAKNLKQHNINANKYRKWLNRRGVK